MVVICGGFPKAANHLLGACVLSYFYMYYVIHRALKHLFETTRDLFALWLLFADASLTTVLIALSYYKATKQMSPASQGVPNYMVDQPLFRSDNTR